MLLFSCEYGSRAMGMGTVDSDHDVMEVHLEPRQYITGLKVWDAKHYSTAGNGRSSAGDTDTTVYGLKHWASLAAKGNPTAMTPLFVIGPGNNTWSDLGYKILSEHELFISKEAGYRYRGYAMSQRQALLGMRNKKTNRPELVHKHGYDTKFAYHALRTLIQGIELMQTGWIQLPITGERANLLQDIRAGKMPKDEFLEYFEGFGFSMEDALEYTQLQEHADYDSINELLHEVYMEGWSQ